MPDTLRWTLDQFKAGNLSDMIQRAGYPGVVADMDRELVADTLANQIEPRALAIRAANAK